MTVMFSGRGGANLSFPHQSANKEAGHYYPNFSKLMKPNWYDTFSLRECLPQARSYHHSSAQWWRWTFSNWWYFQVPRLPRGKLSSQPSQNTDYTFFLYQKIKLIIFSTPGWSSQRYHCPSWRKMKMVFWSVVRRLVAASLAVSLGQPMMPQINYLGCDSDGSATHVAPGKTPTCTNPWPVCTNVKWFPWVSSGIRTFWVITVVSGGDFCAHKETYVHSITINISRKHITCTGTGECKRYMMLFDVCGLFSESFFLQFVM